MNLLPGDVLLVYNEPLPKVAKRIEEEAAKSYPGLDPYPHHCALVLPDESGSTDAIEPTIYEAAPPAFQKSSTADWFKTIDYYARCRMFYRRRTGRQEYVEVWRSPTPLISQAINMMHVEAEALLGTPYRLVVEYNQDTSGLHCSGALSLELTVGMIVPTWPVPTHRVMPITIRETLRGIGWEWVYRYQPGMTDDEAMQRAGWRRA